MTWTILPLEERVRLRTLWVGRRVRLLSTSDPYTDLRHGDEGYVEDVDDAGTIHVQWDNGSTLGMISGEDHLVAV